MKEYIFEVDDIWDDEDEVFYGLIRHHSKQLIRCKDCDNWDCNNVGGASAPCYEWSDLEDGIIIYTDAYEFCSRAERKEE